MPNEILLDACVVLNLLATDQLDHIATVLDFRFIVVRQVAEEAYYVLDEIEGELRRTLLDLTGYIRAGSMVSVDLDAAELSTFVRLAAQVDDGEAATLSIAVHRGLPLATDDRKARRLTRELGLAEPIRTSDLLHSWAQLVGPEPKAGSLLSATEQRARFRPSPTDPHHEWWRQQVQRA